MVTITGRPVCLGNACTAATRPVLRSIFFSFFFADKTVLCTQRASSRTHIGHPPPYRHGLHDPCVPSAEIDVFQVNTSRSVGLPIAVRGARHPCRSHQACAVTRVFNSER
jgi:hypothetical protein